jgi:hypothetical protein
MMSVKQMETHMTHWTKKIVLATLLGLTAVGCGVSKPIYGRNDPYPPHQVSFASEDLRTHTAIGTPAISRDPAGLLFVTLPIRAATDLQLYVDYRVTWLDPTGNVLSKTGWLSKTLAPNVHDQIQVNSLSPRAVDFQIDVRYTRMN